MWFLRVFTSTAYNIQLAWLSPVKRLTSNEEILCSNHSVSTFFFFFINLAM